VLPEIRKTGSYQIPETTIQPGKLFQFSRRDLLNLAIEAETECEELRGEVADLLPKAEFYERVANTSSSFSLGETAKMMEIPCFGRNNLIRFLRDEMGILMSDNVAKQRYIERGYFHIVQRDYFAPDGTPRVKAVTRVYEKGVNYIRRLLDDNLPQYRERQNTGY
jgi:anti-repressor protein